MSTAVHARYASLPRAAALAACLPGLSAVTVDDNFIYNEFGDRVRPLNEWELGRRDAVFQQYVSDRGLMGRLIPETAVYAVVYRVTDDGLTWALEDEVVFFDDALTLVQWYRAQQVWSAQPERDFAYLLFDTTASTTLLASCFLPDIAAALAGAPREPGGQYAG